MDWMIVGRKKIHFFINFFFSLTDIKKKTFAFPMFKEQVSYQNTALAFRRNIILSTSIDLETKVC